MGFRPGGELRNGIQQPSDKTSYSPSYLWLDTSLQCSWYGGIHYIASCVVVWLSREGAMWPIPFLSWSIGLFWKFQTILPYQVLAYSLLLCPKHTVNSRKWEDIWPKVYWHLSFSMCSWFRRLISMLAIGEWSPRFEILWRNIRIVVARFDRIHLPLVRSWLINLGM